MRTSAASERAGYDDVSSRAHMRSLAGTVDRAWVDKALKEKGYKI